jgi:hypothetical protein
VRGFKSCLRGSNVEGQLRHKDLISSFLHKHLIMRFKLLSGDFAYGHNQLAFSKISSCKGHVGWELCRIKSAVTFSHHTFQDTQRAGLLECFGHSDIVTARGGFGNQWLSVWNYSVEAMELGVGVQVLAITFGISALTWALVTATVILLAPFLNLTRRFPPREQGAIASLAGTLMIARSPASAVCPLTPERI